MERDDRQIGRTEALVRITGGLLLFGMGLRSRGRVRAGLLMLVGAEQVGEGLTGFRALGSALARLGARARGWWPKNGRPGHDPVERRGPLSRAAVPSVDVDAGADHVDLAPAANPTLSRAGVRSVAPEAALEADGQREGTVRGTGRGEGTFIRPNPVGQTPASPWRVRRP